MNEQPAAGGAVLTRGEGELSIRLPRAGLRGTKGSVGFTAAWLAIVSALSAFFVWLGAPPLFFAVCAAFVLVGLLLVVRCVSLARRRAFFDVVGDTLLITEERLRGVRTLELPAAEIREIRIAESGEANNRVPVMQLEFKLRRSIQPGSRPPGTLESPRVLGMLSERPDDEIRWIAAELSAALGLPGGTLRAEGEDPGEGDDP